MHHKLAKGSLSPAGNSVSENYGDLRRTPLFFAISNGDATCAKMLLEAGARTELDPLRCILVAIRAERWAARAYVVGWLCWDNTTLTSRSLTISRYDLVQLLLSYGAEVNCYFNVISNTLFPTALQYCLRDRVMQRLLFNSGYHAQKYVNPSLKLRLKLIQPLSERSVLVPVS